MWCHVLAFLPSPVRVCFEIIFHGIRLYYPGEVSFIVHGKADLSYFIASQVFSGFPGLTSLSFLPRGVQGSFFLESIHEKGMLQRIVPFNYKQP